MFEEMDLGSRLICQSEHTAYAVLFRWCENALKGIGFQYHYEVISHRKAQFKADKGTVARHAAIQSPAITKVHLVAEFRAPYFHTIE